MPDRPVNPESSRRRAVRDRRRKVRRWLVRIVALLVVLLGGSVFLVTRSWFIIRLVRPHLEAKLGGPVHIGEVSYKGNGGFVLENVDLMAPGLTGPAARISHLDRMVVVVDTDAIWRGEIVLRDVEMTGLHLRLSEDEHESGLMNFMALRPSWKQEAVLPPTLQIHDVAIQVGSHDGATFHASGERTFEGEMHPDESATGWFDFELREIGEPMGVRQDAGLLVAGRWHAPTLSFEAHMTGLELSRETYSMCPSLVRFWWEELGLEGRVYEAAVNYAPDKLMKVSMSLDDVALTLPVGSNEVWGTYHDGKTTPCEVPPRLFVDEGEIELATDHFALKNIKGTLGDGRLATGRATVPYRGSLEIDALPTFNWAEQKQWLDEVLQTSPFRMAFRIDDFTITPDGAGLTEPVVLPLPIARLLEKFKLSQWRLDSVFTLRRASAPTPTPAPEGTEQADEATVAARGSDDGAANGIGLGGAQLEGEVFLSDARGAFDAFPYPLEQVSAHVTFDSKAAHIEKLAARGADGAKVDVTGDISPLGSSPGVSIHLTAEDLKTSDTLRAALSEKRREVYDMFFFAPSHEALQQSDLLDNLPDFTYGGSLNLDLDFERPPGPDQKVVVSGEASVHELGVIQRSFPYPITIESGRVAITEDRVDLLGQDGAPGFAIRTPGGGRGSVTGSITFTQRDGEIHSLPQLHLSVEHDACSELLYASIPLTRQERADLEDETLWPGRRLSKAARLLKGLGLTGRVDYDGDIVGLADGSYDFRFDVGLDGAATPRESLVESMGSAGLIWPEGFALEDVHARLHLSRDGVALDEFSGHDGAMQVNGAGTIDLTGTEAGTNLNVSFRQLELGPYLVNLAPSESGDKVRELWDRYQPAGHFDLDLAYASSRGETAPLELVVRPGDVEVTLDGQRARLQRVDGEVRLADRQVTFDELALAMTTDDRDDGTVLLNGSYEVNNHENDLRVQGDWRDGRLESPLVPEVLRIIGATPQIAHYRKLNPRGRFDAYFDYTSPRTDRVRDFGITIRPHTLAVQLNDRALNAELGADSVVSFEPGKIVADDVVGRLSGGTFNLAGTVDLGERISIDADIEYHGQLRNKDVEALIPKRIREWATAVKFADDDQSALRDGKLLLREVDTPDGTGWALNFGGRLETSNASIELGTSFTQIEGTYAVGLTQFPGQWPDLDIDAKVDRLLINNREITNLTAFAQFDEATQSMLVSDFESRTHGGIIHGSALFGVGEKPHYEVRLDLAGVGLDGILRPAESANLSAAEEAARAESTPADGQLFGTFTMVGTRGDPASRLGRGQVRAIGDRVAAMPLVLRLVQISQGLLPTGGDLDYADAPFFIQGDKLIFEEVVFENSVGDLSPVQLFGSGSMNLSDFELDMRFQVRTWTPFMRQVLQPIGDQIVGIQVSGPLNDPKVNLKALPGLSNVAAAAPGDEATKVATVPNGASEPNEE